MLFFVIYKNLYFIYIYFFFNLASCKNKFLCDTLASKLLSTFLSKCEEKAADKGCKNYKKFV